MTKRERTMLVAAVERAQSVLRVHADRLRETAEELRSGRIHPAHAANRIAKIADMIAADYSNGRMK